MKPSEIDLIEIFKIWHKVQGDTNLIRMLNGELTVHVYLRQVIARETREISELEVKVTKEKADLETQEKEAEKNHSRKPWRGLLETLEIRLNEAKRTRTMALECLSALRKEI